MVEQLQDYCELGQRELIRCNYVEAERLLADAERDAWNSRDFDTLSRVCMPLQEARRQRRQLCAEGIVCLDLIAQGPSDLLDGRHVVENYPAGQLLVAGWMSIEPAVRVRELARENGLYLETFLGAAYPTPEGTIVAILPDATAAPAVEAATVETLRAKLPPHSPLYHPAELPRGARRGDAQTFSLVSGIWELLHRPFLGAADAQADPISRIEGYRRTIQVDYACELAHQRLSDVARKLAREV